MKRAEQWRHRRIALRFYVATLQYRGTQSTHVAAINLNYVTKGLGLRREFKVLARVWRVSPGMLVAWRVSAPCKGQSILAKRLRFCCNV